MNIISTEMLSAYWSTAEITTNIIIFMNLLGALALGLIVGYERSYHGRAAGMRTYGLVCTASAAITIIAGYPHFWYGGQTATLVGPDPTRVIQGIVTGVGFLGAGMIMRDGFNISGLTTAASIWSSSAIGIMVGVGFYASAMLLTLLSAASMMWISKLEEWLPSRPAIAIVMQFKHDFIPNIEVLRRVARERGYIIADGSMSINYKDGKPEWHFVAVAIGKNKGAPMTVLAEELTNFEGVENYFLSHARN
jgi:putative Mg2+ transporter-C (MgtC) family protein